ncbi:uncharacterized protein LOC111367359 [Olea europaea var. sylvestris]|uniref:uncharacterized protein LOC111367359 n=1 Tax=Olea europaea var. sylvestris TaxID=158386 RepID=UPI000C1D585B|nr:uncharacterized protein LOC111367359 [Olea europaea var. sylvestris]
MGTEVLRPQDCLGDRFRVSPAAFQRRKNTKHGDAGYWKPVYRSERSDQNQKKKFNYQHENSISKRSSVSKRSSSADALKSRNNNGPVMGQVAILRRGESLDSLNQKIDNSNKKLGSAKQSPVDDMVVYGTGRIGPESPEMVPKQIRMVGRGVSDIYAGSAFSMSPSPRSLPVPSFFNNKRQDSARKVFDDSATRDLRRLLRLE